MTDPYAWRAFIVDEPFAMMTDARRVHFGRRGIEDTDWIVGFGDRGDQVIERTPAGTMVEHRGFLIPASALESIAEQIHPVARGPEVARLEEALAVERARVDALLARAGVPPPS